jgi:hypothetical protein
LKVKGYISQLNVEGSISQLKAKGNVSQLEVLGTMVEGGYVDNPPLFVSAEVGLVASNSLNITFDRRLNIGSIPDISDFVVSFSGGALTWTVWIFDLGVNSVTVTLILSRDITPGETGSIIYTPGVNGILSYDTGDAAHSFTELVTNNVFGTVPVFVSATVENAAPTKIVITYDQALDGIPVAGDFSITGKTISGVAIVGATVEVTVTVLFEYGDSILISYTAGASPIKGLVGGLEAANLVNQVVTNNVADVSLIPYVNGFTWDDTNGDGTGNGWTDAGGTGVPTIVTGNGFTGNAQRIPHVNGGGNTQFYYNTGVVAAIGTSYKIRGKFRAGAANWRIYLRNTSDNMTLSMGVNAGNAIDFEYTLAATAATTIIINFLKLSAQVNDYLEIDEIKVNVI